MSRGRARQLRGFVYVWCPVHQKYGYVGKKEAKRARKALHPGAHLDVFECSRTPRTFHLGHLPYHVLHRGIQARGEREVWEQTRPTPLVMPQRVPQQRSVS